MLTRPGLIKFQETEWCYQMCFQNACTRKISECKENIQVESSLGLLLWLWTTKKRREKQQKTGAYW